MRRKPLAALVALLTLFATFGSLQLKADASSVHVREIQAKHAQYRHILGSPTTGIIAITAGYYQKFQGGRVYWHPHYQARALYGAILQKYVAVGGTKPLGFPMTDELAWRPGGRLVQFQAADILWSPSAGAHVLGGSIRQTWRTNPGQQTLGLPTTDELAVASYGRYQRFERGRIYWRADLGAHAVYGAILQKYVASGGASGQLGFPITAEYSYQGGRMQKYQRGYIFFINGRTHMHCFCA